jgi:hypothetical protein
MAEGGAVEYYAALDLARKISTENPGFTVEVAEDKVWATSRTKEVNDGSEEFQEQAVTSQARDHVHAC